MARSSVAPSARRRGRPPEAEREARRTGALDAALAQIRDGGFDTLTMHAVARRAGSSKESLYSWFGSKHGMVAELIRRESAATSAALQRAVTSGQPPDEVLRGIAANLLTLLTGPTSVALNRAAMPSPDLALVLLRHGRHETGPVVEAYLEQLRDRGVLADLDPADAFTLFYGLVVRDTQIRVLLGEPAPDEQQRAQRAARAVEAFLVLVGR